ncbi:MAG: hypothetical protein UHG68_03240, partial [Clostridia bacterium]|nr:hypothetical protein [Clostridia bacterium]
MSREKQIEEMARDICECYNDDGICYQDDKPCDLKCDHFTDAQYLYEKGYRKQKEGEWKFNEERDSFVCSLCGGEALL